MFIKRSYKQKIPLMTEDHQPVNNKWILATTNISIATQLQTVIFPTKKHLPGQQPKSTTPDHPQFQPKFSCAICIRNCLTTYHHRPPGNYFFQTNLLRNYNICFRAIPVKQCAIYTLFYMQPCSMKSLPKWPFCLTRLNELRLRLWKFAYRRYGVRKLGLRTQEAVWCLTLLFQLFFY